MSKQFEDNFAVTKSGMKTEAEADVAKSETEV